MAKEIQLLESACLLVTKATHYMCFAALFSKPNKVGGDGTLPYCDIIQHAFIPAWRTFF